MSGFKDDVLAILRDNVMLHGEALGWVVESDELLKELSKRKLPVTGKILPKPVVLFDYIVIARDYACLPMFLSAMSNLSSMGIIIIDISDWEKLIAKSYKSIFGDFTATPVIYGDRKYLVIHSGVDYGN